MMINEASTLPKETVCESQLQSNFTTEDSNFGGSRRATSVSRRNSEVGGQGSTSSNENSLSNLNFSYQATSAGPMDPPMHSEQHAELMKKLNEASRTSVKNHHTNHQAAAAASSACVNNPGVSPQNGRSLLSDPLELFVQLQKQKAEASNRMGGSNSTCSGSSLQNSVSFSPMSSFSRINTIGSISNVGSFANMGSLSKLSNGNLSMVLSQGAANRPMNGMNNQSWGNLHLNNTHMSNNMNMNDRMQSSLPGMNIAETFGGANVNNLRSMNMAGIGRNMNVGAGVGDRSNDFPLMADRIGATFHDLGNAPFPTNTSNPTVGGSANFRRTEGFFSSEGFASNAANNNNNTSSSSSGGTNNAVASNLSSNDFSKLTTEELRQIIMRDVWNNRSSNNNSHNDNSSNNGGQRRIQQRRASTGTNTYANNTSNIITSNSNSATEFNSRSGNPFLKNLGTMDYRNHVLPLSLQHHSSKARRRASMGGLVQGGRQPTSSSSDATMDHISSTGMFSNETCGDGSSGPSAFPFQSSSELSQQHGSSVSSSSHSRQGTMPGEDESYIAAENGILAPWSDRAAGLLGDMMEQSNEDEKARKASRKKPKDKPKRPLSAYNIFFKEERSRILEARAAGNAASTPEEVPQDGTSNDSGGIGDSGATGKKGKSKAKQKGKTAHGKIGFESLAKLIGQRWQELDDDSFAMYKSKASVDMDRYNREMEAWNTKRGTTSRKRSSRSSSGNSSNGTRRRLSSSGTNQAEAEPREEQLEEQASAPHNDTEQSVPTGGDLSLTSKTQASGPDSNSGGSNNGGWGFRKLKESRLQSALFQLGVEED